MRYVMLWIQMAFGMHSLISGLNYFLEFLPLPRVMHPIAGPFVDSMTAMGLFDLVKLVEVLVGFALIFNRFVPLALLAELPTSITISWMSVIVVHSPRAVYTGLKEILFNLILLAWFAGWFTPLFRPRLDGRPLWREWRTMLDTAMGRGSANEGSK
jgi:hypothetical protein